MKIKIAQIGMGHDHAPVVLKSLLRQSDVFEVVGLAVPEVEREKFASRLEEFSDLLISVEDVFNDPTITAVAIETEEINLTNYAQMAADAGKHIHMDKPGGLSLADFERLIATVKEKHLVFHTGYMYRYNPYVMELMEQIKRGELGEIISVEAQMNCMHNAEKRQWLEAFPGGMMFFLGCHLIDFILQIQGQPKRIIPLHKSTGIEGVTAKDYGMAIFEYEHGVSFAKSSAYEHGGFARRQLVVTGSKGRVELKPLEWYEDLSKHQLQYTDRAYTTDVSWHDMGAQSRSPLFDRYDTMMASFAAMTVGEKENPWSYDYELELYKTVLTACEA